ncbi:hypothetical protein IMSAG249_00285 [Lachnospiraceae bacterium]|jgi:hypothetical protein|nr:hypothetical protein IMSAG249_00285 [Lachnospiraceae bacterium]
MLNLDIGEFLNNIKQFVTRDLLEWLQDTCIKVYLQIFDQANQATERAATQVSITPEAMFPNVYGMIIEVIETCFIPIGGIILACVLCYECVSMLAENNRMREFGPQDIYILIFKMIIGNLLLTHSFEIINGAFKIGQWVVQKLANESITSTLGDGLDASAYFEQSTDIAEMIGFLIVGGIIRMVLVIFSALVKIAVWIRFVELYMFMVSSPIPFATFLNKEWGQIGYNYVRKILSLAFQPVYMILCFSIFSATLVFQSDSGFAGTMTKSLAAMILLILALFKTRTISDSIFNAH